MVTSAATSRHDRKEPIMTAKYTTRDLTLEESSDLLRGLSLALGGSDQKVNAVLRVILDNGCGVFKAERA